MERRLAAILVVDVVGYSRLMKADEAGTLAALKSHVDDLFRPEISEHRGRLVKLMGDGILAEFSSVFEAVRCAVTIQSTLTDLALEAPEAAVLKFRMGINVGDVLVDSGDIYGDGVNIAARLEGLSEPGGICVSEFVYQQIKGKLEVDFADLGAQKVKNIDDPVRAYRVELGGREQPLADPDQALFERPSIALLPFANLNDRDDQDHLADGLSEDLITALTRFRSLQVIARNSCFIYKGRRVPAQQVGRELGVAYLVSGSLRRSGARLRVTAELAETGGGKQLWAESYDRTLEELFDLEEEITRTLAATIGGRVEAEDRDRVARKAPANLKAYDTLLRAQALYNQVSKPAHEEAARLLERAIELDPTNARAHMLLGAVHDMSYWTGWVSDPEAALAEARQHGRRAVQLDDGDSLAHAHLGETLQHSGDYAGAQIQFDKALARNPNDVAARALYGAFLSATGRNETALEQLEIAGRLDPFEFGWVTWIRGTVLFYARRYEEAIEELRKVETPILNLDGLLAACCAYAGRPKEAQVALKAFLAGAAADLASLPSDLAGWQAYWRRASASADEADFEHLFQGLLKAGLAEASA